MRFVKTFFLIACLSCIISGCKKDAANNNCEELKNTVIAGTKDDLKVLVNSYISRMPSHAYTAANMDALASLLSTECAIYTQVLCFDCVFTLPSMSEIQITVSSNQPIVSRVLDISYTPENNMRCVNVHE